MHDWAISHTSTIKAVAVVCLLYAFGGVLTALGARFGLPEERMLFPSIFAAACGFFLLDRRLISREGLKGIRGEALVASFAVGFLGAASALSPAFLLTVQKNDLELDAFTWYEAVHSVVLAPIAEEILFTGFLYTVLRSRHNLVVATLAVAMLFTLAHLPSSVSGFSIRFAHAVCSCLLLERYCCLTLNIGAHSLTNALPVALAAAPELWSVLVPAASALGYLLGTISVIGTLLLAIWLYVGLPRSGALLRDFKGPEVREA